jgi:multicomponent Na+:H+ antiporter subunit D
VSAVQAIQAALLLPLAGTVLVLFSGKRPNLRESISLLIAVATFGVVLTLLPGVMAGGRPSFNLVQLFPEVWLGFRLEPLGMLFALVASGLWILTTAYAIGYMRAHQEHDQTRFFACFALAIFAALGVAFARNLVTLFLFYELLTVSTYPCVLSTSRSLSRRTATCRYSPTTSKASPMVRRTCSSFAVWPMRSSPTNSWAPERSSL